MPSVATGEEENEDKLTPAGKGWFLGSS